MPAAFVRLDLTTLPDSTSKNGRALIFETLNNIGGLTSLRQQDLRHALAVDPVVVLSEREGATISAALRVAALRIYEDRTEDADNLREAGVLIDLAQWLDQSAETIYGSQVEALSGQFANDVIRRFFTSGAPEIDAFVDQHCCAPHPPEFCLDAKGALVVIDAEREVFLRLTSDERGVHLSKSDDILALVDPESDDTWDLQESYETPEAAWLAACRTIDCPVTLHAAAPA